MAYKPRSAAQKARRKELQRLRAQPVSPSPEPEDTMPKPELYYARRPFQYIADVFVDQGQVVELAGVVNDEKLIRLGYFEKATALHLRHLTPCGECGAQFINDALRDRHGTARHRTRERGLDMAAMGAGGMYADTDGDAEERRLAHEAPLYLDKSQASQT